MTTFKTIGLHEQVLKAVLEQGYETPTPIQAQAIPLLLEGRDLLGIAQTGTGKTAAFALPTLTHLANNPAPRQPKSTRALVLAPTRELALQICDSFRTYAHHMKCGVQTAFGGVKINRQIRDLGRGCDILVATPGRLVDLLEQKAVTLEHTEIMIFDEADQMLDLGFSRDLAKIVARVPKDRQTMLFSATMPKTIADLAQKYLSDPARVSVTPESTTAERVEQGVLHVGANDKLAVLDAVLSDPAIDRALVFTRTKRGADVVVRKLLAKGVEAQAIHGNKSRAQRVKALDAFRAGRCRVLIATDIAARGIDVDGVTHVLNYELPEVAEQYVHRIGRTARAGRDGLAISLVSPAELYYLRQIEKVSRNEVPVLDAPAGCEALILPTPDPSVRVRKPEKKQNAQRGRSPKPGGAGRGPRTEGGAGKPATKRRRPRAQRKKPVPA